MIIVYGTRMYGRIQACGRSFLGTRFVHIWYLPLIPVGSSLILEEHGDGSYKGIAQGLSFTSMMAGYLRVWGPIAVLASVCIGLGQLSDFGADEPLALAVIGGVTALFTLLFLVGTVLAWAVIGKLSAEQKRQRSVYALHLGHPIDPADMGDARHGFREGLMETIRERARGLASMGYRMNADPAVAWPHIALDPTHNDEQLITAAFTLARLDGSLAPAPHKGQMEQVHGQLWQRIARSNAPYLHAAL